MSKANLALTLWRRLSGKPAGKWMFSKMICERAPYFKSIRPRFEELQPGRCVVTAPLRRAVKNHIGTFHAIAMCNMAELCGGLLTEVSVPQDTHRWIPKGLRAVAELSPIPTFTAAQDLPVTVNVFDRQGQAVFRAVITMWVTPKKA
jgi:hypothetical protein